MKTLEWCDSCQEWVLVKAKNEDTTYCPYCGAPIDLELSEAKK